MIDLYFFKKLTFSQVRLDKIKFDEEQSCREKREEESM